VPPVHIGESAVQGAVSSLVLELGQGVIQTMFWSKLKVGVAAILFALVTFGGGGFALRGRAGGGDGQKAATAPRADVKDRPGDRRDDGKKEAERDSEMLQGGWEIESAVFDGTDSKNIEMTRGMARSGVFASRFVLFKNDKLKLIDISERREFGFKLTPTSNPKGIDIT
jgi:hypothetical protein